MWACAAAFWSAAVLCRFFLVRLSWLLSVFGLSLYYPPLTYRAGENGLHILILPVNMIRFGLT